MNRSQHVSEIRHATGAFTLQQREAKGSGALGCWLALPTELSKGVAPLVAVHGIRRGAREQVERLVARAASQGRAVIAPVFDEQAWPRYQRVVHGQRADLALLALMRELRLCGIWQTPTFELSGFSGGAQFAHRFAMLYPHLVSRLTVSSAGWFTFPDAAPYPRGLAVRAGRRNDWGPRLAAGLDRFLQTPIRVCVGEHDRVPDRNTRRGESIEAHQGRDRMTRALRWVDALHGAARSRGVEADIGFHLLPGCGHDFVDCVRIGRLDRVILPSPTADAARQRAGLAAAFQRSVA